MAFKSGHEDITHIKANANFDYQDTQSVTANGIRGLIQMKNNDSTWSTGASRIFSLSNSFIQADSVVNICLCTNGGTAWIPIIRSVYNVTAGSCNIAMLNARADIAADSLIFIAYEIIN